MQREKALLAINPRAEQNVVKIPDVVSVLSAAGWETEVALKQYGGQSIEMAREASEDGHDLVIGYSGDGTVNQVVNGIMRAKQKPAAVIIGNNTEVFDQNGQHIPSSAVVDIQEGGTMVVEGKRSKLGVIKATRVIL